jgi:dTDP-4-dehydrorhamnose reductase
LKILLTGAAGMLASAIIPEIERSGHKVFGSLIEVVKSDIHLRLPDIQKVDICIFRDVYDWTTSEKPDFIFHFAAETDVDLCEKTPEHAYRTNYIGTENVALVCQKYEIPLLYISTGAVFNGTNCEPYLEFDITEPTNVYGRSKLAGEITVQRLLKKYFIIRAGWMIGGWEIDKKFVYKIVKQLLEGKKEVFAVNDKFGSPTFTMDFAKNLLPLIKSERYGL